MTEADIWQDDALVCWRPGGRIHVVRASTSYGRVGGTDHCAPARMHGAEHPLTELFQLFHLIVTRDAVDPKAAHEAFCRIHEYRTAMAPSFPESRQSSRQ